VTLATAIQPAFPFPATTSLVTTSQGHVDTFIVSDLHLGLPASRPRDLLQELEQWRFERLILLGDVFHDWSFRHICTDTWRLLAHIHRLSHRCEAEVVWVLGNHDRHLAQLVAKLIGVETTEAFRWSYAGRSYLALHGDRFDRFVSKHVRLAELFSRSYAFAQRWLSAGGEWPKLLDRMHVGLSNLSEQVATGARALASEDAVDVIVCGHTHRPRHEVFDLVGPGGRGIEYFNTGCWVDRPASFVTVGSAGVALNHCP
jgi:UDP-2,3-diacylglucosamine pyrophosphatase LpxH